MKIPIKGLIIDTSLLFRVDWRFPLPKIYLHERFENIAKWISRIIVSVGIGVSLIALPTVFDFSVAILLFLLEVVVEKIVFEYSIIIVQPPPDFKIDESQWITNDYLFPKPQFKRQYNLQNHFGPVYQEEEYGKQYFDYLKSWNRDSDDDVENNICLSFIIEEDNSYTTYIYANPDRKWLDTTFNEYRENVKYEKYGKGQQSMVMQMVYWKTLPNMKETLFYSFTSEQSNDAVFHFCPFYMENGKPGAIESHLIKKYHYSLKKRVEITNRDLEYYYGPTIKIDPSVKRSIPSNPQDQINRLLTTDLEAAINTADSVEFVLSDNYEKSPAVSYLIFSTPAVGSRAYALFLHRFTDNECKLEIRKARTGLVLTFKSTKKMSIESAPLSYSSENYEEFRDSEQSKGKIVFAFGFKQEGRPVIIATEKEYIPFVIQSCLFRGGFT